MCGCTRPSGKYANPKPASAAWSIWVVVLKKKGRGRIFSRCDSEGAGWLFPELTQSGQFRLDLVDPRTHVAQQALARGCRRHASRRSRQQAQFKARLKLLDCVAQR